MFFKDIFGVDQHFSIAEAMHRLVEEELQEVNAGCVQRFGQASKWCLVCCLMKNHKNWVFSMFCLTW